MLLDLSHEIEHGMPTYPGLPAPKITDHLTRADSRGRYSDGAEFHIGRIEMVANTGTYIDAPFHPLRGRDGHRAVAAGDDRGRARRGGAPAGARAARRARPAPRSARRRAAGAHRLVAALAHRGVCACRSSVRLARRAEMLAQSGAALVGIDSVNIDDMADLSRPAHTLLLGKGIPVVEHLTGLEALEGRPFTFFAVPPRVRGMGTFPVRAFAVV